MRSNGNRRIGYEVEAAGVTDSLGLRLLRFALIVGAVFVFVAMALG